MVWVDCRRSLYEAGRPPESISPVVVAGADQFPGKFRECDKRCRIELHRFLEQPDSLRLLPRPGVVQEWPARLDDQVTRIRVLRPVPLAAGALDLHQRHLQRLAEPGSGGGTVQLLSARSAQRFAPPSVPMSWTFTRSASPSLRTL